MKLFFFEKKRILIFLVRAADLVNTFVQSPYCNSCFFFTILSPLLMHILKSRSVRIAIVFGSPLNKTQRSLSCTEVFSTIATISNSALFLC